MRQRGAEAIPVSVVGVRGDLRGAVERALDGDRGTTLADDAQGATDESQAAVDDRVHDLLAETETECVVCGADPALYDAVRSVDTAVPVVVVGSDAADAFVERVLADRSAEYVAAERLAAELPARVERLVRRRRERVDWRLADVVDEAVVAFDLETGTLREANEVFFDHWGWDSGDLADATLADLRETDITHEVMDRRREADEAERAWVHDDDPVESLVANARGGRYDSREWHCLDADGRAFKTTVRVLADERDERGYLVATVPDRSADDDPDEGSMLHSLLEHVPMSVYFKDSDSRHVLVSEGVVEPFIESPEGKILHTPTDVRGKTDFDLYPADRAVESVAEDREVVESGRPVVDRLEDVQPPHGRPLYFKTTKAPWYDAEGRAQGIVGITVDVTDEKRREQELNRQNERLSEFASIVSHDLRNPLNVAKGRLQIYRENGDEDQLETVAEMHDRMEALIDDVLTFAREGSRVEETEWLDPAEAAADAWAAVDTDGAELEQAWDYRLSADPGRLVRLLENCFRNSVEHGRPEGESDTDTPLTVRVGTLADESGFFVEDDGRGIPAEERDEVFDRGVTTNPDGTGFGLPIVREIATAHGWEVRLTESESGGARFEFSGVPRGSERIDGEE